MGEFKTKVKWKTRDFQIVHKTILRYTRTSACDFECNTRVYAYLNYRDDIKPRNVHFNIKLIIYLDKFVV